MYELIVVRFRHPEAYLHIEIKATPIETREELQNSLAAVNTDAHSTAPVLAGNMQLI